MRTTWARVTLVSVAWASIALAASTALIGCNQGDGSITLVFPNDVARSVVRRLRVEAYSPNLGGTGLSDRTCLDFVGEAAAGNVPPGNPVRGDYQCPEPCPDGWFSEQALERVPAGQQIIYVLGYASNETGAMPILEGCTDRFDSKDEDGSRQGAQVQLQFVIPDGARVTKIRGDRQVARPGTQLDVPLEIEVQAEPPLGGESYVIPGIAIGFSSLTTGFAVQGGPQVVNADATGRARVQVTVPSTPGAGLIEATAEALASVDGAESSVRFAVSVTEAVRFATVETVAAGGGRPVALALGDLDGTEGLDLAMVTCDGTVEQCTLAPTIENPGAGVVTVVRQVGLPADRRVLPPVAAGVLPTDIEVVDMAPPTQLQEIAVLNARREVCQSRLCPVDGECPCFGLNPGEPCPCEGAEVRMFDADGDAISSPQLFTLTASNAVAMTVVSDLSSGDWDALAIAGRGRMRNEQPCGLDNSCFLPNATVERDRAFCASNPQMCGCPPNEFCDGPNSASVGTCKSFDKMVDRLVVRSTAPAIYNQGGCQRWTPTPCADGQEIEPCVCEDEDDLGGVCNETDICGCSVPTYVRLGIQADSVPVIPLGIVAGPLRAQQNEDLVVASTDGFGFALSRGGIEPYNLRRLPIVNAPVHDAIVAAIDDVAEVEAGVANPAADLVWIARGPCNDGSGFDDRCPRTPPREGSAPPGCLGVYFSDKEDSIVDLAPPREGGCRRHELPFLPDGLCVGRFNDDPHLDVALASATESAVMVYSGDGRGGLLDPPQRFALPDGGGGPLACADFDGDSLDDIAVAGVDAEGRTMGIVLLRTRP